MDELKLKLSTRVMRGLVAKLLAKLIFKKTGYEVNIQLREIEVSNAEGKVRLHIDADADMSCDDFTKLIKSIGLD